MNFGVRTQFSHNRGISAQCFPFHRLFEHPKDTVTDFSQRGQVKKCRLKVATSFMTSLQKSHGHFCCTLELGVSDKSVSHSKVN